MTGPLFSVRTTEASAITRDRVTVTPRAQAVVVRLPFGGWVWNRPLDVKVERDGQVERVPIVDVTLLAQIATIGVVVLVSVAAGRRRVT